MASLEPTPQGRWEWLKAVTCPRCGDWCEPSGRSFRFGVFHGSSYLCEGCGKYFNAFYRDGVFSHTVPQAHVDLREMTKEQTGAASDRAESTEVTIAAQGGETHSITCPRCGGLAQATGRAFKFGVFDGKSFSCEQCEKHFNAFYRADVLNHTVPVGGAEVIEESTEEPEVVRESTEIPSVQQEPTLESKDAEESPELETSEAQIDVQEPEPGPDMQGEEPEAQEEPYKFVEQAITSSSAGAVTESATAYTPDNVVGFMRGLREDVERIQVLSRNEEEVVGEFSRALMGATSPLSLALPVDALLLPTEMGDIERASVVPRGVLVLLMSDGTMETVNLTEPENRDLLVKVVRDAVPQYKALLVVRKQKIEQRIAFLSRATRDLREIADHIASKER